MRASDILNSTWRIVREDDLGHCIIELDGLFYVVRVSQGGQFESCLPADGRPWFARCTEAGLRYVTAGRGRKIAMAQWRKHIIPLSKKEA